MRPSLALLLGLTALLGGCATMDSLRSTGPAPPPASAVDRDTTVALLLADTLQLLERLAQSPPAEQAEIVASAKSAAERAPLGSAQLRYALVLALPGTPARDPAAARAQLRALAAEPAALAPAERALTLVELAQLERELGLKGENERMAAEAQRAERDRQTVANRRLQNEIDENAKLRKQLDEAQAKLDAIARIERNLSNRPSATEGHSP